MKVATHKREWYPVYEPFNDGGQKDRDDKPWRYEVPAWLWILYVLLYYPFHWVLVRVCESQGDFLR
jgi:hypothetical protein